MEHIFLLDDDARIRVKTGRLAIEKDGQQVGSVPLMKVRTVFIVGRGQVTTDAIATLVQNGVRFVYCTKQGRLKAYVAPAFACDPRLHLSQVENYLDPDRRLALARTIVILKIDAQESYLESRFRHSALDGDLYRSTTRILDDLRERACSSRSIEELRGLEGSATRTYFACLSSLVKQPFTFTGRSKRPPRDPVNAVLSLSYSLSTSLMTSVLYAEGFLPDIGYLHENYARRPALALDLIDPLRPSIDRFVISLFNRGVFREDDFVFEGEDNACHLTLEGSRKYYPRLSRFLFEPEKGGSGKEGSLASSMIREAMRFKNILLKETRQTASASEASGDAVPYQL